jgi:hypothetical protein
MEQLAELRPRENKVTVPLPDDQSLPAAIHQRLSQLPALNNLRMFANVPQCFAPITSLIDQLFNHGTIEPKLREYMYLRIAVKYGLYYEYRHNKLFCRSLGMTDAEITALITDNAVERLGNDAALVCRAAEEITANISISDDTLASLLDRFGREGACEIILLVSWFNLLIRYVESTRVPYEENLSEIIRSAGPLELK